MADNFLEKRYREVFGGGTHVNPETGFEEKRSAGGALAAYRKALGNSRANRATGAACTRGMSTVNGKSGISKKYADIKSPHNIGSK